MSSNRLVYQNWIVDLGGIPADDRRGSRPFADESTLTNGDTNPGLKRQEMISREVAKALAGLTDEEREFVRRFYYDGDSYRRMAEKSGRAIYSLEAVHRRALRKLRKELEPLVANLYRLEPTSDTKCVICNSPWRAQIDLLIKNRERSETWKRIIRTLDSRYGIRISTPQILIGHQKYH